MQDKIPTIRPVDVNAIVRKVIRDAFWEEVAKAQATSGPIAAEPRRARRRRQPLLPNEVIVDVGDDGVARVEIELGRRFVGKKVVVSVKATATTK